METNRIINELGKRVLMLRRKLNISQEVLAQESGISKTYLGELERGKLNNVSILVIDGIARALGVTMGELFEDIEKSDAAWGNDDNFANAIYQKKLEDACYPAGLQGVPVTTLLQFLVYYPLIQPENLIDSIERIGGSFEGSESYVLKQINLCISRIPDSMEKKYAEQCADRLKREIYFENKKAVDGGVELEEGYKEYIERIRQIGAFYKYYRMMVDNSI